MIDKATTPPINVLKAVGKVSRSLAAGTAVVYSYNKERLL